MSKRKLGWLSKTSYYRGSKTVFLSSFVFSMNVRPCYLVATQEAEETRIQTT